VEALGEKITKKSLDKIMYYYFVKVTCPICGKTFKVSRRKKPALKNRPDIMNSRGKYEVPVHPIGKQCHGSLKVV